MCKLIIVTKKVGRSRGVDACVGAQYSDIYGEPHGYSALTLEPDGKPRTFLALAREKYAGAFVETMEALDDTTFAMIHSRTATSGDVTERNLHTARDDRGRWIAHNGIVSGFSEYRNYSSAQPFLIGSASQSKLPQFSRNKAKKSLRRCMKVINDCDACMGLDLPCTVHMQHAIEADWLNDRLAAATKAEKAPSTITKKAEVVERETDTDTFQFLQALPDTLTEKAIEAAIDKHGFNGVACVYDREKHEAWLLTTREIQAHTDGEFMVLYSFRPEKPAQVTKVNGLPLVMAAGIGEATIGRGVYRMTL